MTCVKERRYLFVIAEANLIL